MTDDTVTLLVSPTALVWMVVALQACAPASRGHAASAKSHVAGSTAADRTYGSPSGFRARVALDDAVQQTWTDTFVADGAPMESARANAS
jgi:hypothetical protein